MSIKSKELTPIEISRLTTKGKHPVGGVAGLYIRVKDTGSKSWMLRTVIGGIRKEIGLGGYPAVKLADAKKFALEKRRLIEGGIDPILQRAAHKKMLSEDQGKKTFAICAEEYIKMREPEWKNNKHKDQWTSSLTTYAYPVIGLKKIDVITIEHIMEILNKDDFWNKKTETATRVRSRIENIMDWAAVMKFRPQGSNPARFKGQLEHLLPATSKEKRVVHHPALAHSKLPQYMVDLTTLKSLKSKLLALEILTATRAREARHARWDQVDFDKGMWTVPVEYMKMGKEHRIPLSKEALAIMKSIDETESGFIFESPGGKEFNENTANELAKSITEEIITAHGFRSTFRDWAAEHTEYPSEMIEMSLAHKVGSSVERAYLRTDMVEKRRKLMQDWADYCYSKINSEATVNVDISQ